MAIRNPLTVLSTGLAERGATIVRAGGTDLTMGAVAVSRYLVRSGTTIGQSAVVPTSAIPVNMNAVSVEPSVSSIDFTGLGVTATGAATATITIPRTIEEASFDTNIAIPSAPAAGQEIIYIQELRLWVMTPAVTSVMLTSRDGIVWTSVAAGAAFWGTVTWSPKLRMIIAAEFSGATVRSVDGGATWTAGSTGIPSGLACIRWNEAQGLFLADGWNGAIQCKTSVDGVTWVANVSGIPAAFIPSQAIVLTNGNFMICSEQGSSGQQIVTGAGTGAWTPRTTPTSGVNLNPYRQLIQSPISTRIIASTLTYALNNGIEGRRWMYSDNQGLSWTLIPLNASDNQGFSHHVWLAGPDKFYRYGSVYGPQTSVDGVTWTNQATSVGSASGGLRGSAWDALRGVLISAGSSLSQYKVKNNRYLVGA